MRAYICHTFYHAYIAIMKEMNRGRDHYGEATLILSTMSNDFRGMKERTENSGIFKDVYYFDEKRDDTMPEVMALHRDKGNIVSNMLQRIRYTRLLGKMQEEAVPVDLRSYKDVYVFCDADPIGYYLNYKKIHYHALEDGMNTGKLCNEALISNQGAWGIKKFMAAAGFIHIENGYSRYCIDYEVNDISANYRPPKNMIECPFMSMWEKLGPDEHKLMADIFITDIDELRKELTSDGTRPRIMVLTEPLCDVETRARLFGDLIGRYYNDHHVIVKPHPRDEVDYSREFPDLTVIKGRFPMEVLNDIAELKVEKLVSVITQVDNIRFADEIEYLGPGFLDAYEAPEIHWQMEIFKEQDKKK